jgi:hypothetical protein
MPQSQRNFFGSRTASLFSKKNFFLGRKRMLEPVMQGGGYYNRHSQLQARSAAEADAMLARAVAAVAIPSGPLVIADFGCAQGHNSMRQMALVLDGLAERAGRGRDVMVVHTDLPHSDFTSLFGTLNAAPESYRRGRDNVFSSVIGQSFYDRLLPAGSLVFGWSSFALHWMSALPRPLGAHIWPVLAAADEQPVLAEIGARDWRNFLRARAQELAPGGQLLLVVGAADAAGASGLEPMMDLANAVLGGLVAQGALSAAAYAEMTIPARPRRHEEFSAPFDDGTLPLVLEEMVLTETPNAAMLRWEEAGDAGQFAADITGFFIAAFAPSLFGEDRTLRELFAGKFAAAVALAPADIARKLVTATLRIRRL